MRHVCKFFMGFKYAFDGIIACIIRERNFRIHIAAALSVLIFSFVYGVSRGQAAVLTIAVFLVMAAEAANTAIEAVVDLVSAEKSQLAKTAKDTAAAAVLLAAIGSVVIAVITFSDVSRLAQAFREIFSFWPLVLVYAAIMLAFVFGIKSSKNR